MFFSGAWVSLSFLLGSKELHSLHLFIMFCIESSVFLPGDGSRLLSMLPEQLQGHHREVRGEGGPLPPPPPSSPGDTVGPPGPFQDVGPASPALQDSSFHHLYSQAHGRRTPSGACGSGKPPDHSEDLFMTPRACRQEGKGAWWSCAVPHTRWGWSCSNFMAFNG